MAISSPISNKQKTVGFLDAHGPSGLAKKLAA